MRVRAFAKINLSLRVLGRRADGYHDLRTVFQSIALFDTLTIRRARGPFRLTSTDAALPVDERNLVWRAADAMWKASGRRGSVRDVAIVLVKQIPVAAGLGGGSSDAAATLRVLAKLWRVAAAELPAIASTIGADVPYFLEGGTALGLERGDVLFPLSDRPKAWVVIAVPPFRVSTADAYSWFDRARGKRGRTPFSSEKGPYPFFNDLQGPVSARHPEITRTVSALRRAGASYTAMTGSGSAVFGLFDHRAAAVTARDRLASARRTVFAARTLTRAECRRLAAN